MTPHERLRANIAYDEGYSTALRDLRAWVNNHTVMLQNDRVPITAAISLLDTAIEFSKELSVFGASASIGWDGEKLRGKKVWRFYWME